VTAWWVSSTGEESIVIAQRQAEQISAQAG